MVALCMYARPRTRGGTRDLGPATLPTLQSLQLFTAGAQSPAAPREGRVGHPIVFLRKEECVIVYDSIVQYSIVSYRIV